MKKKVKPLTEKETNELSKMLSLFESQTLYETGIHKISGGFATADMFDYDDEYIDLELKWGIQSDVQDDVHTEQYKLNRQILTSNLSLVDKVKEID